MKTKLDCHGLLAGTSSKVGYINNLDIPPKTATALRNARELIREHLRAGLRNWEDVIPKGELFEGRHIVLAKSVKLLQPKFRMQGSFSYHTVNEPAQIPPQDIDLDDGLFLPTSFLAGAGEVRPVIASAGFFVAVERLLEPLCRERGWKLDRSKSSCVRVILNSDAHIDLPLYAIPDDEFETLIESASALAVDTLAKRQIRESVELAEDAFRSLAEDRIMLAHRQEGWKASDPRKLEDWFQGAVKDHGPTLRRVCRYLKGWRDHQWKRYRLSSIAIMAMSVKVFDGLKGTLPENRDDVALLEVAKELPSLLSQAIPNPVPGLPALCEGWTAEDREEMIRECRELHGNLHEALHGGYLRPNAVNRLTKEFGTRVPRDESLVSINTEENEVLSHRPIQVSAPSVPRSVSG
jgi:hypothetical protein